MIANVLLVLGLLALALFILQIIKKVKKIKSISIHEIKKRLESGDNLFVVDVRSLDEFSKGHISGAVNIPLPELSNRINELTNHGKKNLLVLMCRTNKRASEAYEFLEKEQIESCIMFEGMKGWVDEGFPVEK